MLQGVNWTDGKCSMPTSCPVGECRSRTFSARRSHSLTETIDWQRIRYKTWILTFCEVGYVWTVRAVLLHGSFPFYGIWSWRGLDLNKLLLELDSWLLNNRCVLTHHGSMPSVLALCYGELINQGGAETAVTAICLNYASLLCCRLQETFSDDSREAGRIPRTVDCELTRDLGAAAALMLWL